MGLTTVVETTLLMTTAMAMIALDGMNVEKDGDVCENMCSTNYSDVLKECNYGCDHRSGLRERINPFNLCFNACESRFKKNILSRTNETEFINRAWDACRHACQLPYKTKIRWNVYIDLRSGEPIWNFERIMSDGHQLLSVGMGYEDLINTVSLQETDQFLGRSKFRYSNPFSRLNLHDTDNQMLQSVMVGMLNKVRTEMSRIAPQRYDGISSIDYIGPRIIEHGPNGPMVTDITELQYRPKEVLIYNSHIRRDDRVIFIYFLLFAFIFTMICALAHLRKYHEALQRMRVCRAELARQRLMDDEMENGSWAKKIPMGSAPPSYSSPEK